MGTKNYELIYNIAPHVKTMQEKGFAVNEAQKKFDKSKQDLRSAIVQLSGVPEKDLKFQETQGCHANGIIYHVMHMVGPEGSGHNKCIFCGVDDFDGY